MSIRVEFKVSAPPFRWDEAGGIRIGQSRVTLDSLLAAYHNGSTPEEIAVQYSVLHLEEIYAAIAYYLNHRQETLCASVESFALYSIDLAAINADEGISASPPLSAPRASSAHAKALKGIFSQAKDAVSKMLGRKQPALSNPHLQVISLTGLDQAAINALTQHLQLLKLPSGFSGEIVFEFQVSKGRVRQIMLDEEASTLKEAEVVELIKRSLTTWRPPQAATGTVRITLRIQS